MQIYVHGFDSGIQVKPLIAPGNLSGKSGKTWNVNILKYIFLTQEFLDNLEVLLCASFD